jgi:hypothetical protein
MKRPNILGEQNTSIEFMQKEKGKKRNDKFQKVVKGDEGKKDNEEEWEDFIQEVSFSNQGSVIKQILCMKSRRKKEKG